MRFFLGHTPGAYALLPTVVLTTGHCQCHPERIGAVSLFLTWLGMEAGFELELFTH